nr:aminotransferase class V-fold PLP-dependent enzyme [Spelaeicoccus albus]
MLDAIVAYSRERLEMDPVPLDGPKTLAELDAVVPKTVTEDGIGGLPALKLFEDVLAQACISTDNPRYVSFIPAAPTEAATMFDLVVAASCIYGGSWMEGAGAVYAENQVLSWLASEVGFPGDAGGVFVQGGTLGNLSALVTARDQAARRREADGRGRPERWKAACSNEAHSSLAAAARVMDIDLVPIPVDSSGRLNGAEVDAALADAGDGVFAVVATAGTTNFGIVDDLASIAAVAKRRGLWLHVDGAYGLAGILSPAHRDLYAGVENADSFIVDPHKWLYAPFDACALIYRDPELGRQAHTQHADYLDPLTGADEWNPSDYAYNLTRRARGLPLWFSLATYGVRAYREAIAGTIELAHVIADEIRSRPGFTLVREPELSVVVFSKDGWTAGDYAAWSKRLLESGDSFVVPSSHQGRPVTRFALINPRTTKEDLVRILDSMD